MKPTRAGRAFQSSLVVLVAAVAITSCGKSRPGDGVTGGSAGEGADTSASGGSSAVGGSSQAGDGTGATNEGVGGTRGGSTSSGGAGPDVGGGNTGSSGHGGDSSGVGNGGVSEGGTNESGSAGEPVGAAGAGCPSGDCTSTCGDGLVEGSEACDDGNLLDGDGCSSACTVEGGYTCSAARCDSAHEKCTLRVPAVFRDFNAHTASGGHPDFGPDYNGDGAVQGLIEELLDTDGKPALKSSLSTAELESGYLHGQAAFAEWYRDGGLASQAIPGELVLWDDGAGGYVNRWGKNGEQWAGVLQQSDYGTITAGLPAGMGCFDDALPGDGCMPTADQICYDPCTPWGAGQQQSCCASLPVPKVYNGNPLFFPLDDAEGVRTEPRGEGKVPSQFGWSGVPWESDVATRTGITTPIETALAPFPSTTHNFHFTTEVSFWFLYTDGLQATLDFTGDDDLWVFLNGHLAVDLGGWHVPLNGTLSIDAGAFTANVQINASDDGTTTQSATQNATAAFYGLTDGNVYQLQIFHAERQPEGSTLKFGIHGLNVTRSTCVKN
jgi:fibro-slime domain-containing protein